MRKLGKAPAPPSQLALKGHLPQLPLFPQEAPYGLILPNDGSFIDSLLGPQGLSYSKHSIGGLLGAYFQMPEKHLTVVDV